MKTLNLYMIFINEEGYEIVQSEKPVSESEIKKEFLKTHQPWIDEDEVEVKSVDIDKLVRLLF